MVENVRLRQLFIFCIHVKFVYRISISLSALTVYVLNSDEFPFVFFLSGAVLESDSTVKQMQ